MRVSWPIAAAALLVLVAAGPALASPTEDAYIAGYAAAVLDRDFRLTAASLDVHDGIVTIAASDLAGVERARVVAALSRIKGVRGVDLAPAGQAGGSDPAPQSAQEAAPQAAGGAPPTTASAVAATAGKQGFALLPGRTLFDPLAADPRWPHFAASFAHINNSPQLESASAVSFGEIFPLAEMGAPFGGRWQIGILGAAFALFDTGSQSEDLIDIDYFIGVPINWRNGKWSGQARYFHQSSHLGDEFLLRNSGVTRVNLSYEQADLRIAYDLNSEFRVYGGGGMILRSEPTVEHHIAQAGGEYTAGWSLLYGTLRPVAALDIQAREFQQWQPDVSLRAGVQVDSPFRIGRKLQLLMEYYNGKSPWGQFLNQNIEYYGLGTHFYF